MSDSQPGRAAEDFQQAFNRQWQLAQQQPCAQTVAPLLALYRQNQRDRLIEQPALALSQLLSAETGLVTVLACYYNYSRNPKRRASFGKFHARLIDQGARVLVAELSVDRQFDLEGMDDVYRLYHPQAMWHEEGLYQHLLGYLPSACEVVCRVDWRANVHSSEWLINVYEASLQHAWVQPFDKIASSRASINDSQTAQYMFAVRRAVIEPAGFYTAAISGAAGAVMFGGAPLPPGVCPQALEQWRSAAAPAPKQQDGMIYLAGPGDIPERFAGLGEILQRFQFNPRQHLRREGALHAWNFPNAETNRAINQAAFDWFCKRKL